MRRLSSGKAAVWVLVATLAVVVFGLAYKASHQKGTDAEQVQAALAESIKASREGRPGGVLDKLSAAFSVNEQSVTSTQVAKAIKQYRPDISVVKADPVITDDIAHIISPMSATVSLMGQSRTVTMPNVDIEFHREPAHAWLIFPTTKWRMTEIHLPADAMAQLISFGTMGGT